MKAHVYFRFFALTLTPTFCFGRDDVQTWLQSPIVTNWGSWGSADLCPDKTFVGAFEVKVERNVRGGDDTGLNGVKVLCMDLEGKEHEWVTSKVGEFGIWRGRKNCKNGLATGFKLRSEPNQHRGDDVAGVDMAIYCTNIDGSKTEMIGSGLHSWGDWSSEQHCPSNTGICGIKTQVEGSQGRGDDTALNNIEVACCRLPPICENCQFGRRWKRVLRCHRGLRDCTLKITTGIEKTTSTATTMSESMSFYSKVGITGEAGLGGLLFSAAAAASSEWGQEQVNGRTIEEIVGTMSFEKKEISVTLDCVGWAEELIITRGNFELSTGEFRCVPFSHKTSLESAPPFLEPQSLDSLRPSRSTSNPEWHGDEIVYWRMNCDFEGGDIGSESSPGEGCGGFCKRHADCAHFTWTNENGGTCWLKGNGVEGLINRYDSGALCGWINRDQSLGWEVSGNIQWRLNCDFPGDEIGSEPSTGEACGGICESRKDCSHFTWTNHNGGTCWLKGDGIISGAVEKYDSNAVCGWVNRAPE